MSAVSGVNIAMLPEEQPAFLEYLATTGDIWACSVGDDPHKFKYEPGPVPEFLKRFASKIIEYGAVQVYLGHRDAVLRPKAKTLIHRVGGRKVPLVQDGKVVPRHYQLVGSRAVERTIIESGASLLLRYSFGPIIKRQMVRTNLSFQTAYVSNNQWVKKPEEFVKWARKVVAWMRRRIEDRAHVHDCNYDIPATALGAAAVRKGLKLS